MTSPRPRGWPLTLRANLGGASGAAVPAGHNVRPEILAQRRGGGYERLAPIYRRRASGSAPRGDCIKQARRRPALMRLRPGAEARGTSHLSIFASTARALKRIGNIGGP